MIAPRLHGSFPCSFAGFGGACIVCARGSDSSRPEEIVS